MKSRAATPVNSATLDPAQGTLGPEPCSRTSEPDTSPAGSRKEDRLAGGPIALGDFFSVTADKRGDSPAHPTGTIAAVQRLKVIQPVVDEGDGYTPANRGGVGERDADAPVPPARAITGRSGRVPKEVVIKTISVVPVITLPRTGHLLEFVFVSASPIRDGGAADACKHNVPLGSAQGRRQRVRRRSR